MLATLSEINAVIAIIDRSAITDIMIFCAVILIAYVCYLLFSIRYDLVDIRVEIAQQTIVTNNILLLLESLTGEPSSHRPETTQP